MLYLTTSNFPFRKLEVKMALYLILKTNLMSVKTIANFSLRAVLGRYLHRKCYQLKTEEPLKIKQ